MSAALNTSTTTGTGSRAGSRNGGGAASSSYVSSSIAGPITLQSGGVNVAMPLPKQFGARPLSQKSRQRMAIRPMSAPTGLVRLAAELTAHQVGVAASQEAVNVLKPAIAQIQKQTAVKQLQSAAVRTACERVHSEYLLVESKNRSIASEVTSLNLVLSDLLREQQRLTQTKAQRSHEIAVINSELSKEQDAINQLSALNTKMRSELTRLTKERDHYQREAVLAEKNTQRLRSTVIDKMAETKRMFSAFDIREHELGVAGGAAANGGVSATSSVVAAYGSGAVVTAPVDQSVPAFLR